MSAPENKSGGSSLDKALSLLQEVCMTPVPLRFADLVEKTDLPKATAHRTLSSLADKGLVRFDDNTQLYHPGYGLLELAHQAWSKIDVRDIAADQMKSIWRETGETIHLAVLDRGEVIYIDKLESQKSLRLFSAVGKKGPAYCTGVGKAMMAFLDEDNLAQAIKEQSFVQHTRHTLRNESELRIELAKIRKNRISLDLEEHEEGIQCAASVILNHNNEPIAALSITAPKFRVDEERFQHFQTLVKDACTKVSIRMGAMASN
ncbi:IclR family transcriptional regulator [Marinomonas posidonica]|uniref:Transcriptional regulator, IclR family n=1 Tax=Marinomonas posidonica (strain CECT 7376 / NCIMB 14433 / IVIA-Po-181) TaxID=491952 RepID=F6CSB6_MARPP|nr:IclR family transcriptional regulator [Marinomonas posidonica]AEF54970.1 transcriptional regulator, IclR family [Marinomonas posidonica IVIA-Po-181]